MRVLYKYSFLKLFNNHFYEYLIFVNLNYFFGFGFLAGLCLIIQVITGIFLSIHYTCNIELAFSSIEHIMRDVNNGWLIRYIHSNTASIIFICIYIHIGRGIFYKSFFNPLLWITGIILVLFLMLISFLGFIFKKKERINLKLKYYLVFKYLKIFFIFYYIYYKLIKKFNFDNLLIEMNLLKLIKFFKELFFYYSSIFCFIYNNLFLFNYKKKNYFFLSNRSNE